MWFWWALSAALVSGISVTYNKRVLNRGVHSSVVSFSLFVVLTLVSLPFFLIDNSGVDSTFFLAAFVSAIVFSVAKTIALNIFKNNNLSNVYPLASISPVTLYILSILFLSEHVKPLAVFGIILMAIGVYILNFKRGLKNIFHPFASFFTNKYSMLFLGGIILSNISSISEKIAINHTFSKSIYPLAFWENLFLSIIIGLYVAKTNKNWVREIKTHLPSLLIAGIIFSALYFMVLFGFKDGPISLVSAIKKLEVLVVLIISFLFFGDRPTKKVYIATFIMLLAVLLIKL